MEVNNHKPVASDPLKPEHSTPNITAPGDSETFRTVVGIITPKKLKSTKDLEKQKSANDPAHGEQYRNCDLSNEGLYSRVCKRERRRRVEYLVCVWVLDFCYMAQIAFAAILTALGASRSSFIVITVFGALNVAMAGVLAPFKGLGLPMRLRKDWLEFQKLRHYIDDRERMFEVGFHAEVEEDKKCGCGCEKCKCGGSKCGCGGHEEIKEEKNKSPEADKGNEKKETSHLEKEIKNIQKMYDDLMATIENNQPDFYSSAPASGGSNKRH
jgi:SMODS and SLOG-associating 2TM effector domain